MKSLLKNARENKGFTTRQLSDLLSIDQALISKFENGKRIPTQKQIISLASKLEIDENVLLIAWYKEKLLNGLDFNPQAIQAVTEILHEKGIQLKSDSKKEIEIAAILSEIENLKIKLTNL